MTSLPHGSPVSPNLSDNIDVLFLARRGKPSLNGYNEIACSHRRDEAIKEIQALIEAVGGSDESDAGNAESPEQ